MYIYIYIYMYVYVYISLSLSLYIYIYIYAHIYTLVFSWTPLSFQRSEASLFSHLCVRFGRKCGCVPCTQALDTHVAQDAVATLTDDADIRACQSSPLAPLRLTNHQEGHALGNRFTHDFSIHDVEPFWKPSLVCGDRENHVKTSGSHVHDLWIQL